MRSEDKEPRILAIDPTSRGFGYAVLEGPTGLVDWGVTEGLRADNRWVTAHVTNLLRRYTPARLVFENVQAESTRRRKRVRKLLEDLERLARGSDVAVVVASREQVKRMFADAGATNKEEIADAILRHFPELQPSRPPIRKPWMSEDARMAIFDAVAFALTYFYFEDEETHAA